jgi:DNA polymerase-3 subunit delta'
MPPIPNSEIETILQKQGIEGERAAQIAQQSEGNMDKALHLAAHSDTDYFNHFRDWLNAIYTSNGVLIFNWLKVSAAMSKEELKSFFFYAIHIFEQSLRVEHLPQAYWSLTESEVRLVKGLLSKGLRMSQCEKASELCNQAIYHIERNVHKKVLLNAISLEVQEALLSK